MIKKLLTSLILIAFGFSITLLFNPSIRSQIMETAGLAVAQTATRWTPVADAAKGNDLTAGIMVTTGYLFDGTDFDRPLKSTHGDNLTTSYGQNVASFNYAFDGTNWDRILASTHGDNLTTSYGQNVASFNYMFDGTNWDRISSSTHGDNLTTASGQNVAAFGYVYDGTNWDRLRGDATSGLFVQIKSQTLGANIGTGQVNVTTTATLIKATTSTRRSITIKNQGTVDMFIGTATVTTATGFLIKAGESITLSQNTAAIYGIVASGSTTAGYFEELS